MLSRGIAVVIAVIAAIVVIVVAAIAMRSWNRARRSDGRASAGSARAPPRTGPAPTGDVPGSSTLVTPKTPEPTPRASPAYSAAQGGNGDSAQPLASSQAFQKLYQLALDTRASESILSPEQEEIKAAALAVLESAPAQERYAPRRPHMLPRLMSATHDERISRRELAAIIARDPSLVGSLLRMANSSFYRVSREPVESVDRAVALLGTDGLRSLISAALMQPIFRVGGTQFPRFPEIAWEHAFRSASAAVPHAVLVERSDPFAAELLSLIMGLAGIVIFRVTLDQYASDLRLQPDPRVIAALLETESGRVAQRIGRSWELSERMLTALEAQASEVESHPTPLGRSLAFGRFIGALAVLQANRVIDESTARGSIPSVDMPPEQLERMWGRLTADGAGSRL